ncbi:MAG: hypothetical protein KAZ88_10570 [Acidimicrobiia bacterium]|nr:hypothetical protein [Acidimicrobiia bacterium]MBP8181423.1 hypothetical protein [Acidimicrobiia bacterium]
MSDRRASVPLLLACLVVVAVGIGLLVAWPSSEGESNDAADAPETPPRNEPLDLADSGPQRSVQLLEASRNDGVLLFGLWVRPADDTGQDSERAAWADREAKAGRTLDIGHSFYAWDKVFPTWREEFHRDAGRIPLISWNGTFTDTITDGGQDAVISARARGIKELGTRVMLRWFWEMDGAGKADWAGSPDDYIAAWRHIHDIFEQEGATNVEWVWCPNAWQWNNADNPKWYPGDEYVDWVCADGYNWAPNKPGSEWESFEVIFTEFYDWAAQTGKQIMIGEYGVQEREPGEKADWILDSIATVQDRFPQIDALVYYDEDREERGHYDWRLDTSESSYDAFAQVAEATAHE